jgi:hypothetical protein
MTEIYPALGIPRNVSFDGANRGHDHASRPNSLKKNRLAQNHSPHPVSYPPENVLFQINPDLLTERCLPRGFIWVGPRHHRANRSEKLEK